MSWDKGTTGQAQNLAKDGTGRDSLTNSGTEQGTGRYQILTACSIPVPRDKIGQSRTGCSKPGKGRSKPGKGRSKTGKDVLKWENDVLKKES